MRKLFIIALLFTVATAFKLNSTRHITGAVTDASGVMPAVIVTVEGTAIGTQTDAKGKYSIDVPEGKNTLVFAFVGYKTQKVKIGKSNIINVVMAASSTQLSEVVVVGYAAQKRVSVTGSVSTIRGVALEPVASYGYFNPQENNESYKGITENGFQEAGANPLSTFSIDVDAASYSNVRRFINGGSLPPADAVRIEEMINYFSYNLPGPKDNEPVAITTELSSAPWNTKHRLLRIGLKAKTIPTDNLPASNLVFLIDVSGSMSDENKLPLVKSSLKMLINQLRPQDKVSIVVYAGAAGLVLQPTTGDKKATINNAIDNLEAGGSTAGGAGIKLAYATAAENFIKGGNNRVILATDGDFNVGASSDDDMEKLITKERESGIFLSVLGYGMGNYKDSKMETLADKGNGNYAYIDNITEARKTLVSEFGGTLFTVAKDVKLQIEFNPAMVQAYRLIGYENRLLNKEDFNNDKKDAGDMGSGHTVTALYEIVPAGIKDYAGNVDPLKYQKVEAPAKPAVTGSKELVTIKFRYKEPTSSKSKLSQAVVNDVPKDFASVSTDFKFAAGVAEVGMLLRDSQFKQNANWAQAIKNARAGKGDDHEGYRAEFVKLAESAKLLVKNEELGK
ncbi:DUF3520 domain-containing protein [Mucilaginibacter limnophilus]|uniref:DUF3520 domain-containing protein n=1 Tax=Mucilaginibacter limnophilus TaxID=1932778 RepID=A0A437MVL7_9SPHI|nr:VWA domain-containing protein [Mucilaginibacter limnophilus]RVU01712.1 DUF3520 domain-containing protein [Mucilaginibacter limnophilus]